MSYGFLLKDARSAESVFLENIKESFRELFYEATRLFAFEVLYFYNHLEMKHERRCLIDS